MNPSNIEHALPSILYSKTPCSVVHPTIVPVKNFDIQYGIRSLAMLIGSPANHIAELFLSCCRWAHIQCINTKDGGRVLPEACSSIGSLGVHSLNELTERISTFK